MELIELRAKREVETSGPFKGFQKTVIYKEDTVYCEIPANQSQPRKGSKTIVLNCFKYKLTWI